MYSSPGIIMDETDTDESDFGTLIVIGKKPSPVMEESAG